MLGEALEDMGVQVVEELCTGPKEYNDKVKIVSADFKELYIVNNIRKLGKKGDRTDSHRARIMDTIRPVYEEYFGLPPKSEAPLSEENNIMTENSLDFGNVEGESMFGNGTDMFGNPIAKSPEKAAAPAEPSAGGFVFSLDEDF